MMKKGFTLAEVLITLGVIGVVAALTLPGVMQSYQKKVYVAQLQRVFNEVVNGARSYMQKEGIDKLDEGGALASDTKDFVENYLTASKTGSASSLFSSSYKPLNGGATVSMPSVDGTCAALDSGASVCVAKMKSGSSQVYVDVNGQANPNIIGRDFFVFRLNSNGKVGTGKTTESSCTGASKIDGASYCANIVRTKNWSMDY